jgi:uncharacterized protein (DUF58 family)
MFGVLLAAVNTGNNLIYLLLAMMLSLMVLSGILSEQSLRKIFIRRHFPRHLFAGTPFSLKIRFENRKRYLASFSLRLRESWAGPVPEIHLSRILPGACATHRLTLTFRKRGCYTLRGTKLSTTFPFGLFLKTRYPSVVNEVLVYPQIVPLPAKILSGSFSYEPGRELSKGAGAVYRSLRDYRIGDESRAIHWKTTARLRRLIIREYEAESGNRATVILATVFPFAPPDQYNHEFEEGVRLAASLAAALIRQGIWVRFVSARETIPFGAGTSHLYRILRHLALLTPCREPRESPPRVSESAYLIEPDLEGGGGWPGPGPWRVIRPSEAGLPGEVDL